jgi:hypothetical protein
MLSHNFLAVMLLTKLCFYVLILTMSVPSSRSVPSATPGEASYQKWDPRRAAKLNEFFKTKPGYVLTCYDINATYEPGEWHSIVDSCTQCNNFYSIRASTSKKLRGKKQDELGRAYTCKRLWKRTGTDTSNFSQNTPSSAKKKAPTNPNVTPTVACSSIKKGDGKRSQSEMEEQNKTPSETNKKLISQMDIHNISKAPKRRRTEQKLQLQLTALSEYAQNLQDRFDRVTVELEERDKEIEHFEIATHFDNIHILELNDSLQKMKDSYVMISEDLRSTIEELVTRTATKGSWLRTKVRRLSETVWNEIFNGECGTYLLDKARRLVNAENPYSCAEEIAKVMDLNAGVLNISAYELLREGVEGDEEGKIDYGGGILASKYYVKKAMREIEDAAAEVLPYSFVNYEGIDGIVFEYDKMLDYIIKMFQLDGIARDANAPKVQIAITLDGADLSRNITHVTAGIKIIDPRAIDPRSGLPIGMEGSTKVQSRELCFVFKIVLAKDNKNLYNTMFNDFFYWFKTVALNGFGEYQNGFSITSPQDESSFWKSLKRGGAAKVKTYFCRCCACTSDTIERPRQEALRCKKCVDEGRSKCFHWDVGDVETLARIQGDLDELRNSHGFLLDTEEHKNIRTRLETDQVDKKEDMSNIEFEPTTLLEQAGFARDFVNHDLEVLKLSRRGNLSERIDRLRVALEHISRMQSMEHVVNGIDFSGAYILIEQAIPCILHTENRIGEKFIKMLLLEGYNRLNGNAAGQKEFLEGFQDIVNHDILGTFWRRSNWQVNTGKDKDNNVIIADQPMPNTHARKLINKFELLTTFCIPGEDQRMKWNEVISVYRELMELARQKHDFSDEDIDAFSLLCNEFFLKWVTLKKRDGMTNYIHMIGAGHFTYYLRKWRNLYRYSQQGWESLNAQIKAFFFRRTQRGGFGGTLEQRNSKVEPIAKWIQRKLFFLTGDYKGCEFKRPRQHLQSIVT